LKFSKHIEAQVNKANQRLGLLRRFFEYIDAEVMKLFVAVVGPNLEFVWKRSVVTKTRKAQKFRVFKDMQQG
jgi:hypothetical protein